MNRIQTLIITIITAILLFSRLNIEPIYAYTYNINRSFYIKLFPLNETQNVQLRSKITVRSSLITLNPNNHELFTYCPIETDKFKQNSIQVFVDGKSTQRYSISFKNGCYLIKVPFHRSVTMSTPITIDVYMHDPKMAINRGGIVEMLYPRLLKPVQKVSAQKFGTDVIKTTNDYKVQVIIPSKYKNSIRFFSPLAYQSGVAPEIFHQNNKTLFSFDLQKVYKYGIYALIGQTRILRFKLQLTNKQLSFLDKLTGVRTLILPRDDTNTNQKVYYTNITPSPKKIHIKDGNLLAKFDPSETITIEGFVTIAPKTINFNQLKKVQVTTLKTLPEQFNKYLEESLPYWPVNSQEIQQIAQSLKKDTIYATVLADVKYIQKHINYLENISPQLLERKGALKALQEGAGVCMEFSDTLITLLRAQGIPARASLGNALGRLADQRFFDIGHQWTQVYFPSVGWVNIDPTFSTENSIIINQNINYFTHFQASDVQDFIQLRCITFSKDCGDFKLDVQFVNMPPSTRPIDSAASLRQYLTQNINKIKTTSPHSVSASQIKRLITDINVNFLTEGELIASYNVTSATSEPHDTSRSSATFNNLANIFSQAKRILITTVDSTLTNVIQHSPIGTVLLWGVVIGVTFALLALISKILGKLHP